MERIAPPSAAILTRSWRLSGSSQSIGEWGLAAGGRTASGVNPLPARITGSGRGRTCLPPPLGPQVRKGVSR